MPWSLSNGGSITIVRPTPFIATIAKPASKQVGVVALPAGSAGASSVGFEFTQVSAAALWTIPLPTDFPIRRPSVAIYVGDVDVEADISWLPSTKTVIIEFPTPVTGVAVLT